MGQSRQVHRRRVKRYARVGGREMMSVMAVVLSACLILMLFQGVCLYRIDRDLNRQWERHVEFEKRLRGEKPKQ